MATAKDIVIKQIDSHTANEFVRRVHYSGKVTQNSQLHFGVFLNGQLEGAMQFGPSLDKRKIQGLVKGTLWHEFIELNRLAFTDVLPRNSESRALGIAMRLLKKYAPQIKWVISFADGAQCGDGTIYRASGFILTAIKENDQIWIAPGGARESRTTLTNGTDIANSGEKYKARQIIHTLSTSPGRQRMETLKNTNGAASMKGYIAAGFTPIPGFQLRYIYFIDPTYRARLTVSEIPFSEIEKRGAKMYKGIPGGTGETDNAAQSNAQTGGASPTVPLLELAD